MENSGQGTWSNPYTGPRYSSGQAVGPWDSSSPCLSSARAAVHIHLPASAFAAPELPSKKIFLKASGHSKPVLLRTDHACTSQTGLGTACPQPLHSTTPSTLFKLSPTLARSPSFLHRCTGELQTLPPCVLQHLGLRSLPEKPYSVVVLILLSHSQTQLGP